MQNHGKAKNEYWEDVVTTFRDNKNTILKATYMPILNMGMNMMGLKTSASGVSGMQSGNSTGIPATGNMSQTSNKLSPKK